jgi:hypothetical protein
MRRGAELLTFVLLEFGGCEGERVDPIDVRVNFARPSVDGSTTFKVECDTPGEESAVCAEIRRSPELYFPERSDVCTIPVDYLYATLGGTYGGEEVRQTLSCSDTARRAIRAWAEVLGYELAPLDRR